jgi:iron complex transport system substrate-binding protein
LGEAFSVIELTGQLVGRKAEALGLTERMKRELAALTKKAGEAGPVSVYYELDPTPFSVGPDSFIGTLIRQAGGVNIVPAELGDFPQLSPELVISKNPSVIIGAKLDDVRARPGWERIAAVQSGRVYAWSADEDHLLARPGPRLPQALKVLIGKLHPELSP